jgi:eukaryotic-like serine/threonine-protein kinase
MRRHRIEMAAGTAVLVALVAGLGFAIREARIAERERQAALRHYGSVRNLANTLVFEIDESLVGVSGSTAARKLVVQRAQEYLEALSMESSSDPVLLRELAVAHCKLGEVLGDPSRSNLGDRAGSLASYRKAAGFIEAAVRIAPTDPANVREMAHTYTDLAYSLGANEMFDEAAEYDRRTLQIAETLLAAHPADVDMRTVLARTYTRMALGANQGLRLDEAARLHGKALGIFEDLLRADPDNESRQRQVAVTHKYLGAVLIVQKKHAEALRHYEAARVIEEAQIARAPNETARRYNITSTYNDTGYILSEQGDVDSALAYYEKSYQIRLALLESDPDNARMRTGVAYSLQSIGDNLLKKQDFEGALARFNEALTIRQAQASKFPSPANLKFIAEAQRGLGATYLGMAKSQPANPGSAQSHCRKALEYLEPALLIYEKASGDVAAADQAWIDATKAKVVECQGILTAAR